MINPPCKDCPDRTPGCHGSCERYREFRAQQVELANKKQAYRQKIDMFKDVQRPQCRVFDAKKRARNDILRNRTK